MKVQKIISTEQEIRGERISLQGTVQADENCKRIEWLTAEYLTKLGTDETGWGTSPARPTAAAPLLLSTMLSTIAYDANANAGLQPKNSYTATPSKLSRPGLTPPGRKRTISGYS